MQRGNQRVQAADGSYPYESFQLQSSEDVFLTLTQTIDGVAEPLDLSASSLLVYLRAKVRNATGAPPVNVLMTKRAGETTAGDTGKVSATVRLSGDDFTPGTSVGVMGCYVIDTAVADTPTLSGYQETLWQGLWGFDVVEAIDE